MTIDAALALLLVTSLALQSIAEHVQEARNLQGVDIRTFPYCSCDSSLSAAPWRAELNGLQSLPGGQLVVLRVWADPRTACTANLSKLELKLASVQVSQQHRGAFQQAYIGSRRTTAISWDSSKPSVKFTALGSPCSVGQAGGTTLSFWIANTTLPILCGGPSCLYAAFDTEGHCPVSSFNTTLDPESTVA